MAIKIVCKKKAPQDYLSKFMPREIDSLNATCRHHNVVRIGFSLGAFGLAKSALYPFGLDVGRSRAGPGDTDRTELLITVAALWAC